MSSIKQLFSCCFPNKTTNAEEKIDLSLSQLTTTVIRKNYDKDNKQQGKQTLKNKQSQLSTQGTAIFNVSAQQTNASKTPSSTIQLEPNIMEPYPSNRLITQEEIAMAPIVIVKDLSLGQGKGGLFPNKKKEIVINAGGLEEGGARREKDGVVFFGISNCNVNGHANAKANGNGNKTENKDKDKDSFALDVELQNTNVITDNKDNVNYINTNKDQKSIFAKPNPFLFVIFFIKDSNTYQLKCAFEGTSIAKNVFIKMTPEMEIPIHQTEILSFGSILLFINPISTSSSLSSLPGDDTYNTGQIELTIMNDQSKRRVFKPSDNVVTIGRSKSCSFPFNNLKGFSKIQSTLTYNEGLKCWVLRDGSGTKSSRNGTWLFGINSYRIYSNMIIEVNQRQMMVNVINKK